MNRPATLLLIALIAVGLSGCSGAQKLPAKGPRTASAVLQRALAVRLPKTLQGMSRLDSYVDGEARKADVLLRVSRPDKAQFQALTPTLDMIAVLTTDGQRFISFERGAGRCYSGRACAANIARLIPIALPARQMVEALLGRPPVLPSAKQTLGWDAKRGAYKLTIGPTADGAIQQLWVRPGDFRFLAAVVSRGGKRVVSIAYGGHDKVCKGCPPQVMRMEVAATKTDMSLQLREVTVDEEIEADAFAPRCPTGTVVVDLPCEASAVMSHPPAAGAGVER